MKEVIEEIVRELRRGRVERRDKMREWREEVREWREEMRK